MNTPNTFRRIATWAGFIIVIALIIWGLVAAQNKSSRENSGATILPGEVTADDWVTGNLSATTTLVEYGDFQCPACGAYYPYVKQLLKDDGAKFRLVFRHFPLSQHANAYPAAIAAEAAGKQGKFWEMYDLLYSNQKDWETLTNTDTLFTSYAKTIGIDLAKFAIDIKDKSLTAKISTSFKSGQHAGINQTPTFFINGEVIKTPPNYEAFKALIDAAAQ